MLKYLFQLFASAHQQRSVEQTFWWNKRSPREAGAARDREWCVQYCVLLSPRLSQLKRCRAETKDIPGWLLASGGVGEGLSTSSWEDHTASASDWDELRHQFRLKCGQQPRTWSVWSARESQLLLSQGFVSFLTKDTDLPLESGLAALALQRWGKLWPAHKVTHEDQSPL